MGSIYYRCTISVKFLNTLKDLVSALRINGNRRFIKNYKSRLMCYSAGYIQTAEQTSGKLFRIKFNKVLKSHKFYSLLNILLSELFISYIKSAEIIDVFIYRKLIQNCNILHYDADLTFDFIIIRSHFLSKYFNTSLIKRKQ